MAAYRFEQIFRTPSSEQWSVLPAATSEDEVPPVAGRVDVHFDQGYARITVVLRSEIDDGDATDVIALVDEQLVPSKARGDVKITLWRGAHAGTFVPEGA
ncbi:MAG: hypothetical protein M0R75_03650 [Dehalococcoidia bacterium]|nr:hypothetical protein [Dehalococcoidia bacterium]